jgi:multidrug resistance efflux pump
MKSLLPPFFASAAIAVASTAPPIARAQAPASSPAATQPAGASVSVIAGVEAFWSADQYAKTSGYVSDVKHDIGDRVKKGELLAILHVPELEKNLAQAVATLTAKRQMKKAAEAAVEQSHQALAVAQGQLRGYESELQLAQVTFQRQQELSAGKAATAQQLDDANARARTAQAAVATAKARTGAAQADITAAQANQDVAAAQADVAEAQVQEVKSLLEYTRIIAPFDGVVTRRQVNPGDLVQAATTTRTMWLFTVQQLDTVRVYCDVPEAQAAAVSIGADADVKLYGLGQTLHGKITRTSESIDPASRTMRAEIDLPNPDHHLKPGMYAQVSIKLQPPPTITQTPSDGQR